jgi:acyl dehydratase
VAVGDHFARSLTVTETHLVLGAGLIGDFNPHHVDETYAQQSRFGTRILHGMITSAIMGAPVGMHFHGTALAYLEHNTRFTAPVRAGDTLTTTWTGDGAAATSRSRVAGSWCCRVLPGIRKARRWRRPLERYSSPTILEPRRASDIRAARRLGEPGHRTASCEIYQGHGLPPGCDIYAALPAKGRSSSIND